MFVSAFLTYGLGIRPWIGGGLHDTGSIHLLPALCMGRMGHALCCTAVLYWVCHNSVSGAVERGLIPTGDTGGEVSGAVFPSGRFVKSFLPVSGELSYCC